MSVEVQRHNVKNIRVHTQTTSNRVTVSHFLWMARELEQAVQEGMPEDTEVKFGVGSGGGSLSARCSITQEIP